MASLKSLLWKAWYRSWPARPEVVPGYSMLLPVPGDLPVFTELALNVVKRQEPKHRVETLVIPDVMTPRIREIVEREQASWPGELKLVEMPAPDKWLPGLLKRPHANHWLQLINGARVARGSHAVLHDADLFIDDPEFLKNQYERAVAGRYHCFGVNGVWDDWFAKRDIAITATWELLFEMQWLRSYAPHLHLGHENVLKGETHTFDTTLYPQCLTDAKKISWQTPASGLVHFNYVICTYRYFQASKCFADDNFRVLLVRLLVDLFDERPEDYEAPSVDALANGLTSATERVHYTTDVARKNYAEFRAKVDDLLGTRLLSDEQKERARAALGPFDMKLA